MEKILQSDEGCATGRCEGTVGYEFLNDVTALFVDQDGEGALTDLVR